MWADLDEMLATAFTGRDRRGGVEVEQQQGLIVTVRGGRVVRTEAYSSVNEALAAEAQ